MKKFWYRVFEVIGLVYLPAVGVHFVYGAGRLVLLGDVVFFAEVTGLLLVGILAEVILAIVVG